MKFWLLAIVILIIQEGFSSSYIMVQAYENHHNFVGVSIIFLCATIIEIIVFYRLGKSFQKNENNIMRRFFKTNKNLLLKSFPFINVVISRVKLRLVKLEIRLDKVIENREKKILLFYLSATLTPPWVNAFFAPRLNLRFITIFLCIFIGNLCWYILLWLIINGVHFFVANPQKLLFWVFGITLLLIIVNKQIIKRIKRKKKL